MDTGEQTQESAGPPIKGRPARGRITVRVETADGPPIDLDAWTQQYVALVLRLDAADEQSTQKGYDDAKG